MKSPLRPGFAVRLALREARYAFARVGVYMGSISLGVAALVAIHSFREDVVRSVQDEAEVLMGANARFFDEKPFAPSVVAIVDSLRAEGVASARVTTASSMVLAPASGTVRLLQVRALDEGYPFYGEVTTSPPGRWGAHLEPGRVLVDPAVLTQLRVAVGDTLVVGTARLVIAATVDDLPTDLAYQTAIGPRVHISQATLDASELLGLGGLARHEVFVVLPEEFDRGEIRRRYGEVLGEASVRYRIAEEEARDLSNGVRFLGRFLSLVGLGALLLGGVGVASAIHVYILERRSSIAVLRCLGVGQHTAFLAYLLQAAMLGLTGGALGVALGVGAQRLMPWVLSGVLPVDVVTRPSAPSILAGLAMGVWVALVFALIPLLQVRDVPPLAALRQDFDPPRRRRVDVPRVFAYALLAASVLLLCVREAPEPGFGLGFAGGLAGAGAVIGGVAWTLMVLTRRWFPSRASYPVRQGVSNLFRPRNQTLAVTLALGLGAFVVGTIVEVERNVRADLDFSFGTGRPNLLFFDVQTDQVEGVRALVPEDARASVEVTPLVLSRVALINGRTPEQLREREGADRPDGWALRREYRNTYREGLGVAERLVQGTWWDEDARYRPDLEGRPAWLSLERDVAQSLRVGIGDTITWDVSGRSVPSVVRSIREVDWNRLEPNFFAILEPGALDDAPQNIVMVARIAEDLARAEVQRDLVDAFPNVSALDFSRVQEAIESVLSRVRQAVAFLAGFSALAGVIVLAGTLATSRVQRLREGALLRTLGARRRQILTVLLSEYLALGSIATASGLALAMVAAALIMPNLFDMTYAPRLGPVVGIWGVVVSLTVAVGLLGSRELLTRPPLPILREAPE